MSLEHHKELLGLTVTIDLDAAFKPIAFLDLISPCIFSLRSLRVVFILRVIKFCERRIGFHSPSPTGLRIKARGWRSLPRVLTHKNPNAEGVVSVRRQ
jgi:hypothetical protein